MKAVYQSKYGKSDVLQFGEQVEPVMKDKQVRIRNFAASVNPRDWMIRGGRYQLQFLVPSFPLILGSDFAGEVLAVGSKVTDFKIGDRVFGMKNPSEGLATYAENVVVNEANLAHIPDSLSYNEAAGVPLCALTAWQALVNKADIKAGLKVLVIGASGGVGSFGVQIAKALGADVSAVCSGENQALVRTLGADNCINYKEKNFLDENAHYDIIFDTIGRHKLSKCAKVLKPGGTYVSTVPSPENLRDMALTQITSCIKSRTKKASVVMVKSSGSDLKRVAEFVSTGQIEPVIDSVFALQDAAQAHDRSRSLRAKGKIILQIQ